MVAVPRLKNVGAALAVRNDADSENARLIALEILLSGGALAAGKILTSDANGLGSWQVNPAIEAAQNAQTAADNAQTSADNAQTSANTAQTTANNANSAAGAAQTTANNAVAAAAAADAAAVAAGAAAAAAGVTATAAAAGVVVAQSAAAAAQLTANDANTLAGTAQTTANNAQALAAEASDKILRVMGDEWSVSSTRTKAISAAVPYNFLVYSTANGVTWTLPVYLRGGTWRFQFMVQKRPDAPRVSISIGATVIADPLELYLNPASYDAEVFFNNVTIADGEQTITMVVNGRHPSNTTGYIFAPVKLFGVRTGS